MCVFGCTRLRYALLAGALLFSGAESGFAEDEVTSFGFSPRSTIPNYQENKKIIGMANQLKGDPNKLITIEAYLAKSNQYQYLLFRKVRALRVYEILTRYGVNPAQINFIDLGILNPETSPEDNLKSQIVTVRVSSSQSAIPRPSLPGTSTNYREASGKPMRIYFGMGTSSIATSDLRRLIEFAFANNGSKVNVVGVTDEIGSDLTNLLLSRLRALTVYRALVEMGWSAADVTLSTSSVDQRKTPGQQVTTHTPDLRRVDIIPAVRGRSKQSLVSDERSKIKEQSSASSQPKESLLKGFELGIGVGAYRGLGELGSNTKPGLAYLLMLRRNISPASWINHWTPGQARIDFGISHGRISQKSVDLEGYIQASSATLALEHMFFKGSRYSPFFGESFGWSSWRGKVEHKDSVREQSDSGSVPILGLKAGLDISISQSWAVVFPEIRVQKYLGDFNESLLEGYISFAYGF